MKTAFDILKAENGSDTFFRHNQDEYVRLKDAQETIKAYAEQAIDSYSGKIESDCGHTITKERIRNYHNNVKNELR